MKTSGFLTVAALLVVLAVMVGGTARAQTVLFSDNFDSSANSYDVNYDLVLRQAGSAITGGVINYSEPAVSASGTQNFASSLMLTTSWGRTTRELDLLSGELYYSLPATQIWASPNYDFNVSKYEISVKMSAWGTSGDKNQPVGSRYAGILFGADTQGDKIDVSTSGMAFVVTGNYKPSTPFGGEPSWVFYDRGQAVASGYLSSADSSNGFYDSVKIAVDNSGTSTIVDVWVRDVKVVINYDYQGDKLTHNYITLAGYDGRVEDYMQANFDDLVITEMPMTLLTGHVELQDFVASSCPVAVKVELIQGGSTVRTETVVIGADGNYSIPNVTPGAYSVAFKASQFLRKIETGITVPPSGTATCNTSLLNGDLNGDNGVSSTDLSNSLKNLDAQGQ